LFYFQPSSGDYQDAASLTRGSHSCAFAVSTSSPRQDSEVFVKVNGRVSGRRFHWHAGIAMSLLLVAGSLTLRLGTRLQLPQVAESDSALPSSLIQQTAKVAFPPEANVRAVFEHLPLSFEPNQGQTDREVKFFARGSGYGLFLTPDQAVLELRTGGGQGTRQRAGSPAVVHMRLQGANPSPTIIGFGELEGKSNYLIGNDPSQWHRNVPHFANVRYREVYPGVDLVYYGKQGQLEHDFEVAPGADPTVVQLSFAGQDKIVLDRNGDLVLRTGAGDSRLHAPVIYQDVDGDRKTIAGKFALRASDRVGFEIASYDRSRQLVIDPTLSYSSYLGGTGDETSPSIAVDASFNIYVTGRTTSTDFPKQPGVLGSLHGASDVFVAKLDPNGSLILSTYLGGSGNESSVGIGVDSATNIYVAGTTDSTDFPTVNGFQADCAGCAAGNHVFVTELKPDGSAPLYSTYLAGNGNETATGFALDSKGNAYVTGTTTSTNTPPGFPATANAYQLASLAPTQFFVSKITPTSTGTASLAYSTYFGGGNPQSGQAVGGGIAVDSSGNMYFTGGTSFLHIGGSPAPANDFPILNASQASLDCPTNAGCPTNPTAPDAFVAKINPSLTGTAGLLFSTYLGGSGDDFGTGLAVDTGNNVYVTGSTTSTDIPPSATAFQSTKSNGSGNTDAFIAKLNNPATNASVALTYFSYLGGSMNDSGAAIAVDSNQVVRVTGSTLSTDFPSQVPATPPFTTGPLGGTDAFIARLDTTGSAPGVNFVSRFGGTGIDHGTGIALDTNFLTYLTGDTSSGDFPTAGGPFQATLQGASDAFVSSLGPVSDLRVNNPEATSVTSVGVGNAVTFTYTITNGSTQYPNGPDPSSGVVFQANLPSSGATFTSISSSPGSCASPAGGRVLCSIGTLSSGGTATVTEVLVPTAGSTQLVASGQVFAPPSTSDPDLTNNSASASVPVTDFTIAANPTAITVGAGNSAIYNVTAGAAGTQVFSNSISLSCSAGLPQGTSCTFSTNPLAMTNTSPVSSLLTISTTARPVTTTSLHPGSFLWYAVFLPISGLALLRRTGAKKRMMIFFLLATLFAGVLFQVACGGGTKATPTVNPGTPAGTYTVTVTGTSGSASHGTTVALVVQ
jgi:hypothetical protein